MLSFCFSHVATVSSPFRSSVFHFLAEISKICEIFFSHEKKTMPFDGTSLGLSVRVMTKSSKYTQKIIITQAGTMKLGLG